MPIPFLQRQFERLNPGVPLENIDWAHVYDPTLSDDENLAIFQNEYPGYTWFPSPQVERVAKQSLADRLKTNIQFIEYAISSLQGLTEADREQLLKAVDDLGKRALSNIAAQRAVARLRKELAEARSEIQRRNVLNQIVPVGTVRTVTVERPVVTPPSKAQERFATTLANRILSAPDYFGVLGVNVNSSDEEVRDARNQLLTLFHPDVFPNTVLGTQVTRKVIEAYENLQTQAQRIAYERKIHPPPPPQPQQPQPQQQQQRRRTAEQQAPEKQFKIRVQSEMEVLFPKAVYIEEKQNFYSERYTKSWVEPRLVKEYFTTPSIEEAQKLVKQVPRNPGYIYDRKRGVFVVGEYETRQL